MKYILSFILFSMAAHTRAENIFNGYEDYYRTLPNRLFNDKSVELEAYSEIGRNDLLYRWTGKIHEHKRTIELNHQILFIDKRRLTLKETVAFPGEVVSNEDLGMGTMAYFSPDWVCIENTPRSASGTSVRHQSVYLVRLKNKLMAWKLPSLFGSCKNIRIKNDQIAFYKVTYRYKQDYDRPIGVFFDEYLISHKKFVASNLHRSATFHEPDNVYRFSIDDNELFTQVNDQPWDAVRKALVFL